MACCLLADGIAMIPSMLSCICSGEENVIYYIYNIFVQTHTFFGIWGSGSGIVANSGSTTREYVSSYSTWIVNKSPDG